MKKLLPLFFAFGCAQDVGDVDRTQPNRLRKSLFEGEWYLQKTTFDVPYTAGFTFTGETSELERVRWEIQEQYLIAYRTYELVENTNQPTLLPDVEFKGAPIAAYAIESHFDITREYNALTGEETNVIYENTSDRPWYERDYIRVSWSMNLVASFNFLDDQVSQSPIAYYVQDRDDADHLLVGVRNGEEWSDTQDWEAIAALETADYLDIVDTIFANPEVYEEYDEYGDLYAYPACWFYTASDCQPARVKIRNSFLKIVDEPYEAMAYPDNEVARNDDGTPIRDANGDPVRIPYFDKFGYFRVERDHYDRNRERTESDRTFLISRWGIWEDAPGCKSPDGSYAGCTVRPIVYHLSPGFPPELVEAARTTVAEWNSSLKEVVNHLKYGGTRDLSQVEDVYVLKENTYTPDGDRGQRIGDLRYSFIYLVPEPQAVGPLGYGPSAMDPLTGRLVSGTAYVYGAALETWSAYAADVVQLINGAIPADDFIEGEDIRQYVARARGDYAAAASEIAERGRERAERSREWARSDQVRRARDKQKNLGKRGMRLDHSKVRAKLQAIERTPFEQRLLNDEIVRALKPSVRGRGDGLATNLSPEERARMSPARWGTTGAMRAMNDERRLKIRRSTLTLASFADDAVIGLAESLKGQDWQTVRDTVYKAVFRSTAEHEVGHTLGLRHNFAGSFDALNFHDQYWALRATSPQPFVEPTQEQTLGRMREYQYASIMDYNSKFNSDIHGLGRYDRAAILFGYGQLVEVFEQAPNEPLAELFGLEFALHEMRHYTSYPRVFGGDWTNMMRRKVVPYGAMIGQMTGQGGDQIEVPYRFCSDEYEGAIPSCNTWDEGADPWEVVNNAQKAYEDYYVFNSFSRDAREVEPWYHIDDLYWRYFIHPQIQYQDWVYRAFDLEPLWEYELRYDPEYYGIEDVPFDQAVDGNLSGALASREGLNFLARVIQAPEPGAYYLDPDDQTLYNYSYDTDQPLCPPGTSEADCSELNVQLGDGKYAFSLYNDETGYYFYERIRVIGSFYDKLSAIQTLTSPETNFLGVDFDADLTGYAIGMHLFFPDEVTKIVGGAATEAYAAFAGVSRNQVYEPRDMFAPATMYQGTQSVDPSTSFTIELYAAWLGMAFLNANFDNSFNDSMRIWEEGSGEGLLPAVEDPARLARFTHPRTGRTFIAVRNEDPTKFSPAFDLLTRTQRLATEATPEYREYYIELNTAIIDSLRGMYELYGKLYF
jgi:hypothetical protein